MPHESYLARMLRDDLAAARNAWLKEAKDDPQEYAQRQQSDFLADTNHDGEITDFHSLRHTCGAWLAMTGAPPMVVQTVMRHQSIGLTMDTYGHLFPGQAADAVGRMRSMLTTPARSCRPRHCEQPAPTTCPSRTRKLRSARRSAQDAIWGKAVRAGATKNRSRWQKRNRPSPYKLRT